jgi:hypothetical protein
VALTTAGAAITGTLTSTVAAAGAFTTLSATGGITGTTTNDNAAAGKVGEFVTATVAEASATALVTGTAKTVTSISLTAGDWDVAGFVNYVTAGGTTITVLLSSSSLTTNARGSFEKVEAYGAGIVGGSNPMSNIVLGRYSLASTTTIYLVAQAGFSGSTLSASGMIRARRIR